MRVLLLNDNKIIDKLVTLSAEKCGDDLVKVSHSDTLESGRYDLLIIDEDSASSHFSDEKASYSDYSYTLFIASRGTDVPDIYDKILYKPFLPMELLGVFRRVAETKTEQYIEPKDKPVETDEKIEIKIVEHIAEDMTEEKPFLLDTPFDDTDLIDDITPEEELPSILRDLDIDEVKELLEDVENDDKEVLVEEKEIGQSQINNFEGDITDIELKISQALESLSEKDLMQTIDEEILFTDISETDTIENESSIWDRSENLESVLDDNLSEDTTVKSDTKGAVVLQEMLKMLSDPEIAASLRDMNVSVQISFGEKQ